MAQRSKSPTKRSTPKPSELIGPRLSDAARHLVVPKGIVTTRWPSISATCSALGITFDRWQDGAGRLILAKRADGLYAADSSVISIPRQVGKTYLIGAITIALCIADRRTTAIWTAHRSATAQDTFRDLKIMVERPEVARYIKATYDSGDRREIVFTNGSRILFGAREHGFGRGFKRVGILIFDEAQILTDKALDDMVPTTNRHPNPLTFFIGTPPKPSDPGEAFTRFRTDALDGVAEDVLYIEMSADPDADPNDREQWAKANPSYPIHTSPRAMMKMLKLLGVASFMREGMGIWDGSAQIGVFTAGAWARLAAPAENVPPAPLALGIAADVDQVWLSLGAASERHVGSVLRVRFDARRAEFVAEVARISAEHGIPVAIDKKGPAAAIIPELLDAGVHVLTAGLDDLVQASSDLRDAVESGRIEHGNYTDLNDAVDAATWRTVGDRRVLGRKNGEISMLEAVAWALWAARSSTYDLMDSFG